LRSPSSDVQPIFLSTWPLGFLPGPELNGGVGRGFRQLGMFFGQHPLVYQLGPDEGVEVAYLDCLGLVWEEINFELTICDPRRGGVEGEVGHVDIASQ